jgi:hypothetical protein
MTKLLTVLVLALGVSSAAHAGILIEPYLGYHSGAMGRDPIGAEPEYKDTISGAAFGARLGYKFLGPWAALDVTQGTGTWKDGTPGGSTELDYSFNQLGLTAGLDIPFLVRFWAGYGLQSNGKLKGKAGTSFPNDITVEGSYTKAGIGLGMIPFVSINLEYIMNTYKKVDLGDGGGKVEADTAFTTLKNDTIMFSVSLPINL